jgi:ribosomal protein L37E
MMYEVYCRRCGSCGLFKSVDGWYECLRCGYPVSEVQQKKIDEGQNSEVNRILYEREQEKLKAQRQVAEEKAIQEGRREETLDIPCPICGNHEFTTAKMPRGGWLKTVYWCKTGRGVRPCMGYVCYCKGCDKLYPATGFGFHNGAYECKECGRVQWEYTDLMKEQSKDAADLAQIRRSIATDLQNY